MSRSHHIGRNGYVLTVTPAHSGASSKGHIWAVTFDFYGKKVTLGYEEKLNDARELIRDGRYDERLLSWASLIRKDHTTSATQSISDDRTEE